MDPEMKMTLYVLVSTGVAGITIAIGSIGPSLGEGKAVVAALESIARQPEAAGKISRTLFIGLAMVETCAIYCLLISLIILFLNPLKSLIISP